MIASGSSNATETFTMPADNVTISASSESSCITTGTLITLSDGSITEVEKLSVGDYILAWDVKTQKFVPTPITLLVYHGEQNYNVLSLSFENGSVVRIIGNHVFFDVSLKEYVTINKDNYTEYIGHYFLSYNGDENYSLSMLSSGELTFELIGSYAIVTAYYFNAITDNLVSCTPTIPIYELISSYVKDDLSFDTEQFEEDVAKYGLYDYSLFEEYLSYEQFVQLCAPYFRLAEAKGYTTFEEVYLLMVMYSYIY